MLATLLILSYETVIDVCYTFPTCWDLHWKEWIYFGQMSITSDERLEAKANHICNKRMDYVFRIHLKYLRLTEFIGCTHIVAIVISLSILNLIRRISLSCHKFNQQLKVFLLRSTSTNHIFSSYSYFVSEFKEELTPFFRCLWRSLLFLSF